MSSADIVKDKVTYTTKRRNIFSFYIPWYLLPTFHLENNWIKVKRRCFQCGLLEDTAPNNNRAEQGRCKEKTSARIPKRRERKQTSSDYLTSGIIPVAQVDDRALIILSITRRPPLSASLRLHVYVTSSYYLQSATFLTSGLSTCFFFFFSTNWNTCLFFIIAILDCKKGEMDFERPRQQRGER